MNIQRLWHQHAKTAFIGILVVFILLLLIASGRMVKIAFETQPDCVARQPSEIDDKSKQYRAAKLVC